MTHQGNPDVGAAILPHISTKQTYDTSTLRGYGSAIAHHGEIIQGVFEAQSGGLYRASVTLPCYMYGSEAIFTPNSNGTLIVEPISKYKARRAAELALEYCGAPGSGGYLVIDNTVPVCPGLGSSTCDTTAAIRAVVTALGQHISPAMIAQLAVKAEGTAESIMFGDSTVLFAHCDGAIIEDFGGPLPDIEVLGFNTDLGEVGSDASSFPPENYSWWEIEAFRPMLGLLRRAIASQNPRLVAQVASASARINQRHSPKRHFDHLERLVDITGAIGLQVAHSGTIVGILFDPRDQDKDTKLHHAQALVSKLGFEPTWHFQTGRNRRMEAFTLAR
jgi:uncharacterized protein involved in propanediol utilization